MNNKNKEIKQKNHSPFLIRKSIVFSGLVVALVFGALQDSWLQGLVAYFYAVTLFDFFAHTVLGKKSSDFADPSQLLIDEATTPQSLDRFHNSRRQIRILSLLAASLSQYFLVSAEVFCLTYAVVTVASVLYVRLVLGIVGPVWLRRDDSHLSSDEHIGVPRLTGRGDMPEVLYGIATGFGPYGNLGRKD